MVNIYFTLLKIVSNRLGIFLMALFISSVFLMFNIHSSVSAENIIQDKLKQTGDAAGFEQDENSTDVAGIIGRGANGLIGLMAFLLTILFIYGGFIWMTAQGNEEKVNHAKTLIVAAVIGYIVILTARLVTQLVIIIIRDAYTQTTTQSTP